MSRISVLIAIAVGLVAGPAGAATISLSGFLNDVGNSFLVGPGPDGANAPAFVDDFDIANNTALHPVSVAAGGTITFKSLGFTAGGVDPYFTLFSGTGPGAVFLASNFDQAFTTGGDFVISLALAAGDYTVAIGAFANMSFAENFGSGSLGDGFVGLGQPNLLGSYYYELEVSDTGNGTPAPEPSLFGLIGLAGLWLSTRRRAPVRSRRAASAKYQGRRPHDVATTPEDYR